jgi:7-keto-8-aminopelargonate synthetase-like enzyme
LDVPSSGVVAVDSCHKLRLFSGNDYLGLSVHPAVRSAAAEAALEFGMGPRASALVCGYTYHHRLLESTIAELKSTEVWYSWTLTCYDVLLLILGYSSTSRRESSSASNLLELFFLSWEHEWAQEAA